MADVVLTKEQTEALARCAPIRMARDFEYVPKVYRELPEEMQPVFMLRTLKEGERLALNTTEQVFDNEGANTGIYVYGACRMGVRGWRNYRTDVRDAGTEVRWEGRKSVDCLPQALLLEIGSEILISGQLSADVQRGLK